MAGVSSMFCAPHQSFGQWRCPTAPKFSISLTSPSSPRGSTSDAGATSSKQVASPLASFRYPSPPRAMVSPRIILHLPRLDDELRVHQVYVPIDPSSISLLLRWLNYTIDHIAHSSFHFAQVRVPAHSRTPLLEPSETPATFIPTSFMKRAPTRRGASSFSYPTRIPTYSPYRVASSTLQRRVCASWNARYRYLDASKRMQGWLYGRKPRRFGYVPPLLHSFPHTFPPFPLIPVFLDLPAPWDAIEHAKKALRASHISPSLPPKKSRSCRCVGDIMCGITLTCAPLIRKTVQREYAASAPAWSKSCVLSARSTRLASRVGALFFSHHSCSPRALGTRSFSPSLSRHHHV